MCTSAVGVSTPSRSNSDGVEVVEVHVENTRARMRRTDAGPFAPPAPTGPRDGRCSVARSGRSSPPPADLADPFAVAEHRRAACSFSVGVLNPSRRSTAAITTARARGEPSLILSAMPRPSGRPTAWTASAPALPTRPGIARCSAARRGGCRRRHSGWLRIASATRASGPSVAAAIRPNARARPASVIAKSGAPQPSTADLAGLLAGQIVDGLQDGQLDRVVRIAVGGRRPPVEDAVAIMPACLPEQFMASAARSPPARIRSSLACVVGRPVRRGLQDGLVQPGAGEDAADGLGWNSSPECEAQTRASSSVEVETGAQHPDGLQRLAGAAREHRRERRTQRPDQRCRPGGDHHPAVVDALDEAVADDLDQDRVALEGGVSWARRGGSVTVRRLLRRPRRSVRPLRSGPSARIRPVGSESRRLRSVPSARPARSGSVDRRLEPARTCRPISGSTRVSWAAAMASPSSTSQPGGPLGRRCA